MRMFLLRKGFRKEDISSLEHFVNYGVTADDISDTLKKFGKVTTRNKEDALMSVYSMLLRGEFWFNLDGLFFKSVYFDWGFILI